MRSGCDSYNTVRRFRCRTILPHLLRLTEAYPLASQQSHTLNVRAFWVLAREDGNTDRWIKKIHKWINRYDLHKWINRYDIHKRFFNEFINKIWYHVFNKIRCESYKVLCKITHWLQSKQLKLTHKCWFLSDPDGPPKPIHGAPRGAETPVLREQITAAFLHSAAQSDLWLRMLIPERTSCTI